MTPAVKQALAQWLPIRAAKAISTDALFISRNGGRLTTRAIQNVVKKHIIAAGLNPEGLSTHKLRHTAATLMYKYGHVDIRSSFNNYLVMKVLPLPKSILMLTMVSFRLLLIQILWP